MNALFLFVFIYSVVKRGHQELPERLEPAHRRSRGLGEGVEVSKVSLREAVLRELELILQPVGSGMIGLIAARRAL